MQERLLTWLRKNLFSPWTLCHNSPNPSFRTRPPKAGEIRNPVKVTNRDTAPQRKRSFCGVKCIGVFQNSQSAIRNPKLGTRPKGGSPKDKLPKCLVPGAYCLVRDAVCVGYGSVRDKCEIRCRPGWRIRAFSEGRLRRIDIQDYVLVAAVIFCEIKGLVGLSDQIIQVFFQRSVGILQFGYADA